MIMRHLMWIALVVINAGCSSVDSSEENQDSPRDAEITSFRAQTKINDYTGLNAVPGIIGAPILFETAIESVLVVHWDHDGQRILLEETLLSMQFDASLSPSKVPITADTVRRKIETQNTLMRLLGMEADPSYTAVDIDQLDLDDIARELQRDADDLMSEPEQTRFPKVPFPDCYHDLKAVYSIDLLNGKVDFINQQAFVRKLLLCNPDAAPDLALLVLAQKEVIIKWATSIPLTFRRILVPNGTRPGDGWLLPGKLSLTHFEASDPRRTVRWEVGRQATLISQTENELIIEENGKRAEVVDWMPSADEALMIELVMRYTVDPSTYMATSLDMLQYNDYRSKQSDRHVSSVQGALFWGPSVSCETHLTRSITPIESP